MSIPKERPILMASDMVHSTRAGTKTTTRRLVQPGAGQKWLTAAVIDKVCRWAVAEGGWWTMATGSATRVMLGGKEIDGGHIGSIRCPFGAAGDRLYVRESYAPRYFDGGVHAYMADWTGSAADVVKRPKWTPSILMPRAAARIFLGVAGVRVERLQDISEADAVREGTGCARIQDAGKSGRGPVVDGFANYWDRLASEGSRWSDNRWVWVVDFLRMKGSAS